MRKFEYQQKHTVSTVATVSEADGGVVLWPYTCKEVTPSIYEHKVKSQG